MDIAAIRLSAQRTIHAKFATPSLFARAGQGKEPDTLLVRYHNSMQAPGGDLAGEGFTMTVEMADTLIFDRTELRTKNIGLMERDLIVIRPVTQDSPVRFQLDTKERSDGSIREVWRVSRLD